VRKLSDYLTIVIVTPIFLVLAIGVTTAAESAGVVEFARERLGLGLVLSGLVELSPVLIGWGVFTLVYLVMPNRRSQLSSAALGGFVAALLWQITLRLHIAFQIGVANYNAIYAGFAALPIFLVWVQLSWWIVLLGAELAFAHECEREYHGFAVQRERTQSAREGLALRALTRVCSAFLAGEAPRTAAQIAAGLWVSPREIEDVLEDLVGAGLASRVEAREASGGSGYVPARDPGAITLHDVLAALRGAPLEAEDSGASDLDRRMAKALSQLDAEARSSAHNRSLREWVEEDLRREARETTAAAQTSPRAT
jgi:membrane protein